MTKKADMSSRYAAAHARREQRRRETSVREYLPLAEETHIEAASAVGIGERIRGSTRSTAVLTSRLPAIDYSYLRGDLVRTLSLVVGLFAVMIVLSLVLH
jgi:hypothetical protein